MKKRQRDWSGKRLCALALSLVMGCTMLSEVTFAEIEETTEDVTAEALTFSAASNVGGTSTDAYTDVAYTNDGGFVAVGYTQGDGTTNEWTNAKTGTNDGLVVKYDENGTVEWTQCIGSTSTDTLFGVDVLEDGSVVTVGYRSFTYTENNTKYMSGTCYWIRVMDPENPSDYTEYFIGGTAGEQGLSVATTSDGGFVIGGWTASKTGYITSTTDGETYATPVQLWEAYDGTDDTLVNRVASSSSDDLVVKIDKDGITMEQQMGPIHLQARRPDVTL